MSSPAYHVDAVETHFMRDAGAEALVDARGNNDAITLNHAPEFGSGSHRASAFCEAHVV